MKRIWNVIRQDLTLSMRDNIMIYMMAAPILLTLLMKVFVPTLERVDYSFAVGPSVEEEVISRLTNYVTVERYDSRAEVEERVRRSDDFPGLVREDGAYSLILEGNEDHQNVEAFQMVAERGIVGESDTVFVDVQLGDKGSFALEYVMATLVLMCTLLSGAIMGFNMVNDRYRNTIRAFSVSPLRMREYTLGKSLFALVQSLITGIVSVLIMFGGDADYGLLIMILIAATPLSALFGMMMAQFADNQITALGVIKFLMPVYLSIPILSIFVPAKWHPFFYIFPNYWVFVSMERVFIPAPANVPEYVGYWLALSAGFGMSLLIVLGLTGGLKRKLRLR